jgi:hypothetical protein
LLGGLTLISLVLFFTGIHWGLPSRRTDRFLFGDVPVWSGERIMSLAGARADDPRMGTDISRHLLKHRDQPQVVNVSDVERAEIIRRYRLYTAQPDEHVVLMVIARMRPSKLDFDPRYYQYGGLFLYPLAACLKIASIKHLYLTISPSVAWYIDHPEAFGRFYVVARAWAAVWAIVGVWAVFAIARRFTGGAWYPAAAALAFALMPVAINQAHEAKPHMQGTVLELLAALAAYRFVETGRRQWAWTAGAVSGAAFASVLYGLFAFAVLPIMVMLRPGKSGQRLRVCVIAGLIGFGVYAVTNPYVFINLVRNREVLRSNLGNTTAMYHVSWWSGIPNALRLIGEGASVGLAAAGALAILAVLMLSIKRKRAEGPPGGRFAMGALLAGPFVLVMIQYFTLAAGKPGEYGRFALYLDAVLAIAAIAGVSWWVRDRFIATMIVLFLLIGVAVPGVRYVRGFARDAKGETTRWTAAQAIEKLARGRPITVGTWVEPAPFSVPPVDLFRYRLLLLPVGAAPTRDAADVLVRTEDDPSAERAWENTFERWAVGEDKPTKISWANKPFVIDTPEREK